MINIAVIIGKMDSGGKKTLIMNYVEKNNDLNLHFDFIVDKDSNSVPKGELEKLDCGVFYICSYKRIFKWKKEIKKILKSKKYDLVHSYLSLLSFIPLGVAKKENIPVRIAESISMGNPKEKRNIIKSCLKIVGCKNATHYLACGKTCGIYQFGSRKYFKNQIYIFNTSIDTQKCKFNESAREKMREMNEVSNKFVVGFIGRFIAQKNPLFIIDIFYHIHKFRPNSVLWLVGDGNLRTKMEKRITKYGINNDVVFWGINENISNFYNGMDCFVLPSLYEGLSVVALEAQCFGLPLFASTNNPPETQCTDICYRLSIKDKPEYWAKKILSIDSVDRTAYAIRVKKAGFDIIDNADKLSSFYETVKDSTHKS